MTAILIILGSILGTILFFGLIGLYLYNKLKQNFSSEEIGEFSKVLKGEVMSDKEAYSTKKTILGMTNVLSPQITKDFPDFNLEHLYREVEECITTYLSCLTNRSIAKLDNDKMLLMKESIRQEVENMKGSETTKEYKDINFSKHVLKNYQKSNGTATITTQTQLSYLYDSNIPKEKRYKGVRKETIFTCKFVYVTDETKYGSNAITIRCPNCAAPYDKLDGGNCSYCGTYIKPVNLKMWKIVSIIEEKY